MRKNTARGLLTLAIALIVTVGLGADEPPETVIRSDLLRQSGLIMAEQVFTDPPFPHCHASTIAEIGDGLVAAWFAGSDEGNKDVGIWMARKIGREWSCPRRVADGVLGEGRRYPCWNPVLYNAKDGPLILFYKVGPDPDKWWGMMMKSYDGGSMWTQPKRLPDGIYGPIRAKPVMLEDGRLLCGSSTENKGWRVHMEWTSDLGMSWKRTGPLNDGKEFAAIQPTILTYGDGKIQILTRGDGNIREAWSSDGGSTWTPLRGSKLPNPSAGIDAVNLQDERKLLVYNHSTRETGGRSKLNVALSEDGVEWKAALHLEDEVLDDGSRAHGAYPAAIQTADGLVHVTYTGWRSKRIHHVVIDPERLVLRQMEDGKFSEIVLPREQVSQKNILRQPGLEKSEFIFRHEVFTECHSPTLVKSGDTLTVGWMSAKHPKHYDAGVWYAQQTQGGWSEPKQIVQAAKADGPKSRLWNPSFYQVEDGPLLLFYRNGPNPHEWWGMMMRSHTGSRTWNLPERLPNGYLGPTKNKPVMLKSGNLLCGSSTEADGWQVHMEWTSDLGKTWHKSEDIADPKKVNAIQPTILRHGQGKLQILTRTAKGRKIATSWSTDNGETWTALQQVDLPNASAGIDAVTLDDGRFLLVYNHTDRWNSGPDQRRERLNVAVSRDGIHWKAALLLEHTLLGEFAYPAVIQTDDGMVHVAYSWNRRKLRCCRLDPDKLELQEIENGEWPSEALPQTDKGG